MKRPDFLVPKWVDELGLSPRDFRVFAHLHRCRNAHTGLCCPSVQHIAKTCHLALETVKLALAGLRHQGLIASSRRGPLGGNHYLLWSPGLPRLSDGENFRPTAEGRKNPPSEIQMGGISDSDGGFLPVQMGGISAHKGIEKGINKGGEGPPRPQFQVSDESDEAWLARVRQDWPGVDIEAELAKARRKKPEGVERGWFERHWLPGCSPKVGSAVTTPKPATDHPARWREVLDALYPGNAVSSDPSRSWASLPPERKTDVINYIEQNGSGRSASTQRNGRFFAQNGAGTRSFDKHGEGAA